MTGNFICIGAIEGMAGKSGASNVLAMFVALVSVTLIVFIWAAFFRKPPRRRHHHSRHQNHRNSSESSEPNTDSQSSDSSDRKQRFRRRRRHKERRLNPTLSKTGGLPGIRSDDSEPPHT